MVKQTVYDYIIQIMMTMKEAGKHTDGSLLDSTINFSTSIVKQIESYIKHNTSLPEQKSHSNKRRTQYQTALSIHERLALS